MHMGMHPYVPPRNMHQLDTNSHVHVLSKLPFNPMYDAASEENPVPECDGLPP